MEKQEKFTVQEEIANALSHLFGMLLSMAGLVLLMVRSASGGNPLHVTATAIFGGSLILLYFSSAMTHILPSGRAKDRFFNLDRIAIYLLIAGTYTPISLITLSGPLGWVLFGLEWGLALAGILLILKSPGNFQAGVNTFFVISYAVMGWMILIALVPVIQRLPLAGWLFILFGGACYTLGILFFKIWRFPYHHLVWHLLVLAGSLFHFFAIYRFVLP